jgi:hypothetical protein
VGIRPSYFDFDGKKSELTELSFFLF